MIVLCEKCRTRFQLDDARVPAGGVRVRCSRCKHAFLLRPPAGDPGPSWDESTRPGGPEAGPESPAEELFEPPGTPAAGEASLASDAPLDDASSGTESDWEFNMDSVNLGAGPDSAAGTGAPAGAGAEASDLPSFEDIGDPESWDFLADEERPAAVAEEAPAAEPSVESVLDFAAEEAESADPAAPPEVREPASPPRAAEPAPVRPGRLRLGETIGWTLTLGLLVVTAHGAIRLSAPSGSDSAAASPVAGFELEALVGRQVENAPGGWIYVVSGRLRNTGPLPRPLGSGLRVSLRRGDGRPLPGFDAPAGPALSTAELRDEDPTRLRQLVASRAGTLARQPVAAGSVLDFDAIFQGLPAQAARVVLEASVPSEGALEIRGEPTARGDNPLRAAPRDAPTPRTSDASAAAQASRAVGELASSDAPLSASATSAPPAPALAPALPSSE